MAAPVNDLCVNALVIASLPYTNTQDIFEGTNTAGDPVNPVPPSSAPAYNGIWYKWTAPSNMSVMADLLGTPPQTGGFGTSVGNAWLKLMVVTGTCGGAWTTITANSTSNPSSKSSLFGRVQWNATSGTTYYLHAGTLDGATMGDLSANLTIRMFADPGVPANDLCANAITISALPYTNSQNTINATKSVDDPVVTYWGESMRGVWYKRTVASNTTLTVNALGSNYEATIALFTGTCGSLTELESDGDFDTGSEVEVTVAGGTTVYIQVGHGRPSDLGGGALTLNVTGTASSPPPRCLTATSITSLPFTHTQDTTGLDESEFDPDASCSSNLPKRTAWYQWTAPNSGLFTLNTAGSDHETLITVFTGPCDALVEVGCANAGTATGLGFVATNGVTYRIMVGAKTVNGGMLTFNLLPAEAPSPPTLTLDAISAMSVRVKWTVGGLVRVQRCTGAGCSSWAAADPSYGVGELGQEGYWLLGKTYAQRIVAGTTYRYRAYVEDTVNGNSDFGPILEVTTPTGMTGLTQIGGAVGFTSSLEGGNAGRDYIAIRAGGSIKLFGIYLVGNGLGTADAGCEGTSALHSYYHTQEQFEVEGPMGVPGITGMYYDSGSGLCLHCPGSMNQTVELRFRLGTTDYITGHHLSDGYYEARVHGAKTLGPTVVLRAEGLPLGLRGTPGWLGVRISPTGKVGGVCYPENDPTAAPGHATGGMTEFYMNSTDVYGAGFGGPDPRFNVWEVYENMTNEEMWWDINPENPWVRMCDLGSIVGPGEGTPLTPPSIINGKVLGLISMMEIMPALEPSIPPPTEPPPTEPPPPNPPPPCVEKTPCTPPTTPPPTTPPPPPHTNPYEFLCEGGGTVPHYPTVEQPSMAGVRDPRTWVRIEFIRDEGFT